MLLTPPQISKDIIKRLTDCLPEIQKKLHNLAIREKIFFYIIRRDNSELRVLSVADIEGIYKCRPHSHEVILQRYPNTISDFQNCIWDEVWINEDDEKQLLQDDSATNIPEVIKYKTPLMEIMYKAIEKFWLNYNPNQPPKSDTIVAWLSEQGIADRNAIAIDSIIRPEHLKSGGNKSHKPRKG